MDELESVVAYVLRRAPLDAAGYAAATAHGGGIRTVRLPTAVLAQADSGVGAKVETHKWDMPEAFGRADIGVALARELRRALDQGGVGPRP